MLSSCIGTEAGIYVILKMKPFSVSGVDPINGASLYSIANDLCDSLSHVYDSEFMISGTVGNLCCE